VKQGFSLRAGLGEKQVEQGQNFFLKKDYQYGRYSIMMFPPVKPHQSSQTQTIDFISSGAARILQNPRGRNTSKHFEKSSKHFRIKTTIQLALQIRNRNHT